MSAAENAGNIPGCIYANREGILRGAILRNHALNCNCSEMDLSLRGKGVRPGQINSIHFMVLSDIKTVISLENFLLSKSYGITRKRIF